MVPISAGSSASTAVKWKMMNRRLRPWIGAWVWKAVLVMLAGFTPDSVHFSLDNSIIYAHVSAAGGKRVSSAIS